MSAPPKRRRRGGGCCGLGCAGLLAFSLLMVTIYVLNNRPPDILIPTPPPLPTVNAYDDFVLAGKMASAVKHPTPSDLSGPPAKTHTLANFAAGAKDAAPSLAMLHQALSKPYRLPPARSLISTTPFASFRNLARTLADTADYHAIIGQPDRAVDLRLDSMEFATEMPNGGGLISALVSDAMLSMAVVGIEPLLPKLSAQALAHVTERLERIAAKRVSYADIVTEEGWEDTMIWQESLPRATTHFVDYYNMLCSLFPDGGYFPELMLQFALENKTAMLKENLACYSALAVEARTSFTTMSHVPIPSNLIAHLHLPIVVSSRMSYEAWGAVTQLLRAEVALYRYHAAQGRYPASLSELVPAYLPALPDDPFGGGSNRPLRYKLQPGGKEFLLYSLGPDMKDDGGRPMTYLSGGGSGDIVAGHLFKPHKLVYP